MNQRDLELLSSYLDGQLSPSDVTRLEARLQTDPQLASVLTDLRATRALLRKLPKRRAPRNFTLTRKMVGLNPPLPRTYPLFRFASAIATLMLLFSFGVNSVGRYALQAPVGFGMGGGGGDASQEEMQSFAAEAAPQVSGTEALATEDPSLAMAVPAPTLSAEDAARLMEETAEAKNGVDVANADVQNQAPAEAEALRPALIPVTWQVGLGVIALLGVALMFVMRQMARGRWR